MCTLTWAVAFAHNTVNPDSAQALVPVNKEHLSHYIKSQIPLPHILSSKKSQHHTTTKAAVPFS